MTRVQLLTSLFFRVIKSDQRGLRLYSHTMLNTVMENIVNLAAMLQWASSDFRTPITSGHGCITLCLLYQFNVYIFIASR